MSAGAMRLWNRAWMSTALLALLVVPAAADKLDDVKARGKLVVGVSDTTPPFSFRKLPENTITGYDIDLVKGVARRMGVSLEMVPVSSAERIPLLQQDKLDFVATSMTRTRERLRDIDFSHIYFVTPHAVIVRKESGITSVRQLAGRKASSASTSTAGGNLKDVVADVSIVYVRDYALAFAALKAGEVDAFTTDETVLRAIVRQDGHPDDYVFLPDFTKSRDVGFALKQNEPRLKATINQALLDLESSGEAATIWKTWFGPGTEAPMARTFKIQAD
ncbi:MAG: polar amino acid transport system substrate-binding protein [Alphaproteobacteria bacterium]|nr:polar amino acid transport system substrate-binding protein [Alphaproteobacteria bacterium]